LCLGSVYSFSELRNLGQNGVGGWVWLLPLIFIWVVCCLAETNRAPFDFAEGESELVSGFNIEYRSFEFAILFIAEYVFILLISILTCVLFITSFGLTIFVLFFVIVRVFIFARGSYPRFRYDQLIIIVWKRFLLRVIIYMIIIRFLIF
jgi:NADH-ubiquinone oxidoreductase chain 1